MNITNLYGYNTTDFNTSIAIEMETVADLRRVCAEIEQDATHVNFRGAYLSQTWGCQISIEANEYDVNVNVNHLSLDGTYLIVFTPISSVPAISLQR